RCIQVPESKIDAIAKTNAALWDAVHLSKGSPNLLRIISGQLSRMPVGEVMSAVVQKAAKGAFKVTLNGESFIIKGLPISLLGKAVSFVARQTPLAGKSGIELLWLGPSRAKNQSRQAPAQSSENTTAKTTIQQVQTRANILSGLSADLIAHSKSGKVIHGRVDSIQTGKMTLDLALANPKNPTGNIKHQIQIPILHGFKQGQQFSARIQTGMNNQAVLEMLSQQPMDPAVIKNTGKPQPPLQMASFTLAEGDIAPALVQKRLPNGHVQLNIQGIRIEAPAPKSIAQGDLLILRMNKPPSEFQLLSVHKNAAEKAMAVVKNNLAVSHEPLANNIAAMRNLLPVLAAAGMPDLAGLEQLGAWLSSNTAEQKQAVSGEHLARIMRDSGASLEAKMLALSQKSASNPSQSKAILHDLKAIMLQLSNVQSSNINHAGMIKILAELSQHSSARIESNQALNVLAQMHGDPVRFELPMLVGQQMVNVQMAVQQQDQQTSDDSSKNAAADQSYSVLFALELSGLGNMRVDASISDTSVHARIYSEQSDARQFIREHIQRLETRLQNLGYKDVFLLASQSPPDAQKQRDFDQLTHMAPASVNLLDVIA
ncbi:MAG: flagellar hook-length control protein FliK, partial [Mariprofundus sp.]|nr:flagellar hook-length control protein FliK [Mariprofundus sp.]